MSLLRPSREVHQELGDRADGVPFKSCFLVCSVCDKPCIASRTDAVGCFKCPPDCLQGDMDFVSGKCGALCERSRGLSGSPWPTSMSHTMSYASFGLSRSFNASTFGALTRCCGHGICG